MIAALLAHARRQGASDLHLVAGAAPVLRIAGEIVLAGGEALRSDTLEPVLAAWLGQEVLDRVRRDRAVCLAVPDGGGLRARVQLYMRAGGVEAAIRLFGSTLRSFETLGLPESFAEVTRHPGGLVLITGATGQGKTTTFNALLDRINQERRAKIITVEDPVEHLHRNVRSLVTQLEIPSDFVDFDTALLSVLRQDPDVIGIGEVRDRGTMATALRAAETGHLVFATLHTRSAAQSVNRIVDLFPLDQTAQIRSQLASSLVGVISQRLLKRIDGPGRALACEVLLASDAVRNLIRENKASQFAHVLETSERAGMKSMERSIASLHAAGVIDFDTAQSAAPLAPRKIAAL